jgi:large subunit ribosomal protein L18
MRGSRTDARRHRHFRVRKKVHGSATRPRLAVFRSNKHIYAQLIDDDAGVTMTSASSREAKLAKERLSVETATEVGKLIGGRAKEAGVDSIVFDRGGFAYHGRVKAVADGAREAGLEF